MEFRFRAGESKAEPWITTPLSSPPPPPPSPSPAAAQPSLEALQRELEEEKIKAEILETRLNQKRMAEELQMMERTPNFRNAIAPTEIKKRKASDAAALENARGGRLLQQARKEWSCALCMVSATNEEGLKSHLQGKKHAKKAAELDRGKEDPDPKENPNPNPKPEQEVSGRSGKAMVRVVVDGITEWVVEKGNRLLCERCGVKCNSKGVMVTHLSGKKHRKHDQN